MSNLISIDARREAPITLDGLFKEASSLGAVRVWQYEHGSVFQVTIRWKRKSGSEIEAVGKDSDLYWAFGKSINEARELGAGEMK